MLLFRRFYILILIPYNMGYITRILKIRAGLFDNINFCRLSITNGDGKMPLMSIIGCTEFEKEIVRLLAEDGMIEHLLVMGDQKSSELISDLEQMGLKPKVLLPETIPHGLKKSKDFNVLVTLQDRNRYRSPQHMKKETYEKIKFYGPVSNGILMCYDSCEGIFDDAMLDFRNSKFFLELLSSEKEKYMERISERIEKESKMNSRDAEPDEKYRNCYNRLKDLILSPRAN